jgi:hypothetical protein
VWDHAGLAPGESRWALSRAPPGACDPQALLATALAHRPQQRLEGCVRRGARDVTLEEARAHLGSETPRQWPERAMARTTPALLGLSALGAVRAQALRKSEARVVRTAAW